MKKLALAVGVIALSIVALSIGTANAQTSYQDMVGTWVVNIDACRPCVMVITAVDARGNIFGTHTSLDGETTSLVGKVVVDKNGDVWLRVTTPFGMAVIEVALCENEMGGYYSVAHQHRQLTYKKVP